MRRSTRLLRDAEARVPAQRLELDLGELGADHVRGAVGAGVVDDVDGHGSAAQRVLAEGGQAGADVLPRARPGDDDDVEHTGLGVRDRHGRRLELMGGHDGPRTLHDARPPPVRGGPPSSGSERAELAAHAGRVYAQSVDGVTGQATARPEDPVRAPEPPQSGRPRPVGPRRRPGGAVGVLRDPVLAGRLTRLTTLAARARIRRRFLVDAGMLALGAVIAGLYDRSITSEGLPWAVLFVVLTFVNLRARGLYDVRLRDAPLDELWRIVAATSTARSSSSARAWRPTASTAPRHRPCACGCGPTILLGTGRLAIAAIVAPAPAGGRRPARDAHHRRGRGRAPDRPAPDRPARARAASGRLHRRGPRAAADRDGDDGAPLLGSRRTSRRRRRARRPARHRRVRGRAAAPAHRGRAPCRRLGVAGLDGPAAATRRSTGASRSSTSAASRSCSSRPADPHSWQFAVKYALDRLVALVLLVLISPLLAAIAVLVKLSSAGPVFYRQPRVSLDGVEFMMLKFRTMVGAGERDGHADAQWAARTSARPPSCPRPTTGTGPRTRWAGCCADLSLDELPQLLNVLFGDMSLVGPRPERSDLRAAVQRARLPLRRPPPGQVRADRLGAGPRAARRDVAGGPGRVGQLLHRELDASGST